MLSACGFESLQAHQLRNSHRRFVSGFAENCAVMGISSPSVVNRAAGFTADFFTRDEGRETRPVNAVPVQPPECGSKKRSWSIRRGTNPRSIRLRAGSHSGSAVHSAAPSSRPPLLLFLFWTVHGPFVSGLRAAASRRLASDTRLRAQSRFLLEEKTGAPARPAAWGEEEGTEQSAVLAVRRGRSGRSFFRRHGGCIAPAIAGIQSPPPEGRAKSPALQKRHNSHIINIEGDHT